MILTHERTRSVVVNISAVTVAYWSRSSDKFYSKQFSTDLHINFFLVLYFTKKITN
jgi:hypothetical protein